MVGGGVGTYVLYDMKSVLHNSFISQNVQLYNERTINSFFVSTAAFKGHQAPRCRRLIKSFLDLTRQSPELAIVGVSVLMRKTNSLLPHYCSCTPVAPRPVSWVVNS
jgi:hypothetical protein